MSQHKATWSQLQLVGWTFVYPSQPLWLIMPVLLSCYIGVKVFHPLWSGVLDTDNPWVLLFSGIVFTGALWWMVSNYLVSALAGVWFKRY